MNTQTNSEALPLTNCSPSDSDTPETDAITGGADVWNAFEEEIIALAHKLERQRDELAEALREMRYGHTDKAERMAVAALSFLENAKAMAPPTTKLHRRKRLYDY
jgi:hypothetical protein